MASQILVSFEDKKTTIANWVAALSEVPIDNIGGIEEWGKLPYPAAYLSKVTETNLHRPIRVSENIDGQLKSVVYSSKQVQVDVIFVTKDVGDYSDVAPEDYQDAEYYANSLQARLYDPEGSLAALKADGLSLQSDGPIRKRDEQREDGWLRKQIIEIGFGYVQQSAEDQYQLESIENIRSVTHFLCPDNAPPDCSPQEGTITVTFVQSVDGRTGEVVLTEDYAGLDSETGKINEDQALLPDVFEVGSEVEQLALEVKQGDLCIRTDDITTYVALNNLNESLSDWQLIAVSQRFKFSELTFGTFDLSASDRGKWLEFDNDANAVTLNITPTAVADWEAGDSFRSSKRGTGDVSYIRGIDVQFLTQLWGEDVDFKIDSSGDDGAVVEFTYRGFIDAKYVFYVDGPIKSV